MKPNQIINLVGKIRRRANKYIIKELEMQGIKRIVPSHGDIIFGLFNKESESMKEIATRIERDKSTITTLVNKLIELGIVQKEQDIADHRVSLVTLTEKGKNLRPIFHEISDKLITRIYKDVSEEEKEKLIEIIMKIKSNLEE